MDRALEVGINFFDTANVYGCGERQGHHRDDHRRLVRPGRRAARARSCSRPSSTARWSSGRTTRSCRRCNIRTRVRRLAATPADRLHRSLPDAPRRPTTPWEEIWEAFACCVQQGKVALLRVVELRRLAPGAGAGSRAAPGDARPGQRAVDLQPGSAHHRARGAPGGAALRHRGDPVVPALRRRARRDPATRLHEGRAVGDTTPGAAGERPAAGREVRGVLRRARRATRPTSRSRGCWHNPASPRRSSGRARSNSSTATCAPSTSRSTTPRWPGSTRSGLVQAAPRRRPTPGDGLGLTPASVWWGARSQLSVHQHTDVVNRLEGTLAVSGPRESMVAADPRGNTRGGSRQPTATSARPLPPE